MNIYYLLVNKRGNCRQEERRQKIGSSNNGDELPYGSDTRMNQEVRPSRGRCGSIEQEEEEEEEKEKEKDGERIGSNRREAGELEEGESEARQRGTAGALSPRE